MLLKWFTQSRYDITDSSLPYFQESDISNSMQQYLKSLSKTENCRTTSLHDVYFSRYTASKRTGVELADRAMDRWSQPREPNTNEWNTCSSHVNPNERCVKPAALWDSRRVRKQIHLTYGTQACVCVSQKLMIMRKREIIRKRKAVMNVFASVKPSHTF